MRRTRFISWFFLVLGLAFFALPNFHRALESPLAGLYFSHPAQFPGLARFFTLRRYVSNDGLLGQARAADERGDSQFTAFAALNLPAGAAWNEVGRLADRAVEHDRSLTWIYVPLLYHYKQAWDWASASEQSPQYIQFVQERIARLQAFDPSNAVPHLMHAELIRAGHGANWPPGAFDSPQHLNALAAEKGWRAEMETAFRSPRYDSYQVRRFELTRQVLHRRRWAHPTVLISLLGSAAPDFFDMQEYADLLALKLGPEAEAAHRMDQAVDAYWEVAQFGQRLELSASDDVERTVGATIEQIGERKLGPVLARIHRPQEAALAGFSGADYVRQIERARAPLVRTANRSWSIFLVNLSACLVPLFLAATLISFLYVNLRRRRREGGGIIYQFLTIGENYAPIGLFTSAVVLYLAYVPYAQNFTHVMNVPGPLDWIPSSLAADLYPVPGVFGNAEGLPLYDPFHQYAIVAAVGLAAVVVITITREIVRRRKKPGWQ